MQSSIWKVAVLAGVLGAGVLVVMQAQQGLTQPQAADTLLADPVAAVTPNSDTSSNSTTRTGTPTPADPVTDAETVAPRPSKNMPTPADFELVPSRATPPRVEAAAAAAKPDSVTPTSAENEVTTSDPVPDLAPLPPAKAANSGSEDENGERKFNLSRALAEADTKADPATSASTNPDAGVTIVRGQAGKSQAMPADLDDELNLDEAPAAPSANRAPPGRTTAGAGGTGPGRLPLKGPALLPSDEDDELSTEANVPSGPRSVPVNSVPPGRVQPIRTTAKDEGDEFDPFPEGDNAAPPKKTVRPVLGPADADRAKAVADDDDLFDSERGAPARATVAPRQSAPAQLDELDLDPPAESPKLSAPASAKTVRSVQPSTPAEMELDLDPPARPIGQPSRNVVSQPEELDDAPRTGQPRDPRSLPLFGGRPSATPVTSPAGTLNPAGGQEAAPRNLSEPIRRVTPTADERLLQEEPVRSSSPPPLSNTREVSPLTPTVEEDYRGDGTIHKAVARGALRPQLTIEKSAPPNAVLGQPMVYSIVVRNVGNTAADQVVVEDRIPKGSDLTGTIPRAEIAGKKLIWKLGTLKPNEERKISVRVVPVEEGQIGSIATVNFVSEVAAETIITAPRIHLDVQAPQRVRLGEPVVMQFRITNNGSGDAKGVFLRDVLPDGLRHADGSDLEYEVGVLPAGKSRDIKLTLTAAKVGNIVNRTIVTSEGVTAVDTKTQIEVMGAQLGLSRTGPKHRYVGRTTTYTTTVTNETDRPVAEATIIEVVPEGMDFVEASHGGTYAAAQRQVSWRLDKLGAREAQTLSIKLVPKVAGNMTSVVRVFDGSGSKHELSTTTVVEGYAALDVEIPAVEGPLEVGEQLVLRVIAKNRGANAASNVALKMFVPREMEVVSVKGPAKYTLGPGQIHFAVLPTLDSRQPAEFEIILKARQRGDARLQVQIQGDQMQLPLKKEEAVLILGDLE